MSGQQVLIRISVIVGATVLFALALYLLSFYNKLYQGVKNRWLRKNLSTLSIAFVVSLAFVVLRVPSMIDKIPVKGFVGIALKEFLQTGIIVLFVFNTVWFISNRPAIKKLSFAKHHAVIILSIVVSALFIYMTVYYI